jgi:hypothetical protein
MARGRPRSGGARTLTALTVSPRLTIVHATLGRSFGRRHGLSGVQLLKQCEAGVCDKCAKFNIYDTVSRPYVRYAQREVGHYVSAQSWRGATSHEEAVPGVCSFDRVGRLPCPPLNGDPPTHPQLLRNIRRPGGTHHLQLLRNISF